MSAKKTKWLHSSAQPLVDKYLLQWFKNTQNLQHPPPISRPFLQAQARFFVRELGVEKLITVSESWDASEGFIGCWCHRYI